MLFSVLCFNPYFSGCFSLRPELANEADWVVCEFQSLFFWMLLSKPNTGISGIFQQGGFNPYFSGCFSLRGCVRVRILLLRRFQSLFFWMLLSKLFCPLHQAGVSRQSFNPYFSGCFSLRASGASGVPCLGVA